MRNRLAGLSCAALFAAATGCVDTGTTDDAVSGVRSTAPLRGAIFTTTVDGSRVNDNIYDAKPDVYLDGGPGVRAPASAAALPAGDYYFQVTDPSGKTLLSTDAITCRRIHVNDSGVIDSDAASGACAHATGVDSDHASLGAITVQLMPYADTPNKGGEYKVWVTPVDAYVSGADDSRTHGFLPRASKTDNFKVRAIAPPPPPPTAVCGNGVVEEGEQCDDGNTVDGDGCSANCTIEVPPPPPPPESCCGNGILESGEECDDGNNTSGDGCSSDCHFEIKAPAEG